MATTEPGVAAAARGAVYIGAFRVDVQGLDGLFEQHRFMLKMNFTHDIFVRRNGCVPADTPH